MKIKSKPLRRLLREDKEAKVYFRWCICTGRKYIWISAKAGKKATCRVCGGRFIMDGNENPSMTTCWCMSTVRLDELGTYAAPQGWHVLYLEKMATEAVPSVAIRARNSRTALVLGTHAELTRHGFTKVS